MKIGFISDAHGNHPAFISTVARLREEKAEIVYFLGDAVGYWPKGVAVVEDLLKLKIDCLMGNHEAMLCGIRPLSPEKEKIYQLEPVKENMPEEMKKMIREEWPQQRIITYSGRNILAVHGRPNDPLEGYLYEDEAISGEEGKGYDVVVMGHTHRPFVRKKRGILWINCGSCGLPREKGGKLSCAVYDTEENKADIFRLPFDFDKYLSSLPPGRVARAVMDSVKR